jgi:hypothetical protein
MRSGWRGEGRELKLRMKRMRDGGSIRKVCLG